MLTFVWVGHDEREAWWVLSATCDPISDVLSNTGYCAGEQFLIRWRGSLLESSEGNTAGKHSTRCLAKLSPQGYPKAEIGP